MQLLRQYPIFLYRWSVIYFWIIFAAYMTYCIYFLIFVIWSVEHPVLLTEAPLNPRKQREEAAKVSDIIVVNVMVQKYIHIVLNWVYLVGGTA